MIIKLLGISVKGHEKNNFTLIYAAFLIEKLKVRQKLEKEKF